MAVKKVLDDFPGPEPPEVASIAKPMKPAGKEATRVHP